FPVILNRASANSLGGAVAFTQIFPGPAYSNTGGRLVIFTNNARIEIPTLSDRVLPYFVAGGGIASTRRTAEFSYILPVVTGPSGPTPIPPQLRTVTTPVVSSSTDLALTIGGGVGFRIVKRMSVDVDLRLVHLLGYEDANVG